MNAHSFGWTAASVAFVAAAAVAGLWSLRPPDPPGVEPPLDQFSVARAMRHVESIAKAPHFIGTPAHEQVRQYLLRQIAEMGVEPVEQAVTVVRRQGSRQVTAVRVRNVAARLKGTGGGRAILLMAHYDSAPAAPGAADDGHAVAVLLETLRALKAGRPLRNDVIFLFTDAEEAGLWGARAFVDGHPWLRDVRLVVNLEARGTGGPIWMFRTMPGSGWLVRAFGKAAPYPQASSLGDEVFKFMPNNTDLTEFRRTSYPGMDFAFIDHPMYYHSELDKPENLDRRSVYQQGSNAVALARYLGDLDLSPQPRGEAVYHGTAKTGLLIYSKGMALPLALVAAGLAGVAAAIGFRRRRLTWLGVLAGMGALLVAVAVSFAAGRLAEPLLERGLAARYAFGYRYWIYQLAFLGLGVAITSTIYGWLLRRTSMANLWMGGLTIWAVLAVASSVWVAAASFVLVWPLAAAAAAATVWMWWSEPSLERWGPAAAVLLLSAPAVFLMAQLLSALMASFPIGGAGLVAALGVLLAGLLVPHIELAGGCGRWWLPAASLAASLVLFVVAIRGGFDARHPRPDTLSHAVDADANRAYWLSYDDAPDAYTSRFLGANPQRAAAPQFFPGNQNTVLQAPAPVGTASPTLVDLTASRTEGELRVVELKLTPQRAVSGVYLYFDAGVEIEGGTVDGTPIPAIRRAGRQPGGRPVLIYGGLEKEGGVVELRLTGAASPLRVLAIDRTPGVQDGPRPAGFMTYPFNPDMALVRKTYEFR